MCVPRLITRVNESCRRKNMRAKAFNTCVTRFHMCFNEWWVTKLNMGVGIYICIYIYM